MNLGRTMFKKAALATLLVVATTLGTSSAHAESSTDARLDLLEKQVATLRAEVDALKALQKQALFLKNCVNKEKSTNNLKVSLKLASCTVEYFKAAKAAEEKAKK